MAENKKQVTAKTWVYISGIAIVIFVMILIAAGVFSAQLANISTPVYFFLLVMLALAAAGFLFGALRSSAKYNGKAAGGTIELGGPVVLLVLMIYLGYKFKPDEKKAFSITLNIFSAEKDSSEINNGNISLYFGTALIKKQFSGGQVVFAEIPQQYNGATATIIADADGYETQKQQLHLPATDAAENVYLQKKKNSVLLRGNIISAKGKPVADATIIINDGLAETTSNGFGNFSILLSLKDGEEVRVKVYKNDKVIYNGLAIISSKTSLNIQI